MSKIIKPRNKKGQRHGYWETYSWSGELCYKGFFHYGKLAGYEEIYYGKLIQKTYNI